MTFFRSTTPTIPTQNSLVYQAREVTQSREREVAQSQDIQDIEHHDVDVTSRVELRSILKTLCRQGAELAKLLGGVSAVVLMATHGTAFLAPAVALCTAVWMVSNLVEKLLSPQAEKKPNNIAERIKAENDLDTATHGKNEGFDSININASDLTLVNSNVRGDEENDLDTATHRRNESFDSININASDLTLVNSNVRGDEENDLDTATHRRNESFDSINSNASDLTLVNSEGDDSGEEDPIFARLSTLTIALIQEGKNALETNKKEHNLHRRHKSSDSLATIVNDDYDIGNNKLNENPQSLFYKENGEVSDEEEIPHDMTGSLSSESMTASFISFINKTDDVRDNGGKLTQIAEEKFNELLETNEELFQVSKQDYSEAQRPLKEYGNNSQSFGTLKRLIQKRT